MQTLKLCRYQSPVGFLSLVASSKGLRALLWPEDLDTGRVSFGDNEIVTVEIDSNSANASAAGSAAGSDSANASAAGSNSAAESFLFRAVKELDEYFAGTRRDFDLPLDLVGTDFQVSVWRSLADIAYGATATYGEQAAAISNVRAVRAVGAANGKNPVSIVLPCHRVVGSDGKLTGFAGGLEAKAWLLAHETSHTQQG